jgi:aminopeptidase N
MIGKEGFKQALNLYFSRHKGQAVTTEEFVKAMEGGGKVDLTQFRNWYDQGGTPLLKVNTSYDAKGQTYSIDVEQSVRQLDGYPEPQPFHIPLAIGLLDSKGNNMLKKDASDVFCDGTVLVDVTKSKQTITFDNITEEPILSLLRNFSAPVKVDMVQSDDDLLHLMHYDNDPYNKWEACNRLITKEMQRLIAAAEAGKDLVLNPDLISTLGDVLQDNSLDYDMKRLMITLPDEATLHGLYDIIPVDAIYQARKAAKEQLVSALEDALLNTYTSLEKVDNAGARGLKNLCLSYLSGMKSLKHITLANAQFANAKNFTDESAAFRSVVFAEDSSWKINIIPKFADKWKNNADVMDSWFSAQVYQDKDDVLEVVKDLMSHKAFDDINPNKLRSVIGAFTANYVHFHNIDGSGYTFLADQILRLNSLNPQVASRFMTPFTQMKRFDKTRQQLMHAEVQRIANHPGLSTDVAEKAEKMLN